MDIKDVTQYKMNEKELMKAEIADKLLNTFNGSYKPHCFDVKQFGFKGNGSDGSYKTIYIENHGYTMACMENNNHVCFFNDILDYMIAVANIFKFTNCTKETICENNAIIQLGEAVFYRDVVFFITLNNPTENGFPPNFLYNYFGDNPSEETLLRQLGFDYTDRGLWILEL